MNTYTISQFKTHASQILRELVDGEEVVITRRGLPWRKLTALPQQVEENQPLRSLRGILATPDTPDWDSEQLQGIIKGLWKGVGEFPDADDAK